MDVLVAITGASGAVYGIRLLQVLKEKGMGVSCIISDAAHKILEYELEPGELGCVEGCYNESEIGAPFSSGSAGVDAMVVVPCSMKTLSSIANGLSDNLITRSADVMIKERRRLVLVPRETPLSPVHLENMLKLSKIGVTILPAMPGFYHKPKKIEDLIDFIVGKILDSLDIENRLYSRWKGL